MKVLFVINQLFRGGAETALVNLLSAMPSDRYEIDLMIYDQIDLPDTISLIDKVPHHVKIHNIAENENKTAFIKKAVFKLYNKITGRTAFRRNAYRVLSENEYDIAVSFGEWFSSSLVAKHAKARWKYVWIHADADKADFFHPDINLYHRCFDGFIFVSNNSRLAAEKQYPFLKDRSHVVNNMVSDAEISEMLRQNPDVEMPRCDLPVLVTVANVRPEKNHLRQVRVMKRLFDSGLRFYWLNVGSQANTVLTDKIKSQLRKNGLEDYFIFTGASKNPYSVMKRADAVCVLSDHESWSMVITEAKTLGTPVIATKTSGALEQIVDKENGVLCEFDDGDIAEKIREFLENTEIGESIRDNLRDFSSAKDALAQLDTVFTDKKKLLYVFDDINYMSGARTATLFQADSLRKTIKVDLFSVTAPKDENLVSKYRVTDIEDNKKFKCLSVPTREVLSSKEYSKRVKLLRLIYAVRVRLGIDTPLYQRLLKNELTAQFNSYDFIIVVSEASKLRHFVATLKNPKKIQWIHTDYVEWQKHSPWTEKITSSDEKTYKKYDRVVCLSESLCDKFSARYPSLKGRAVAIPNLIDYESIIEKSQSESDIQIDKSNLNLITIGRMEAEKRYESILKTAKELRDMGVDFAWYLVGDGDVLEECKALSRELNVSDCVIFTGYLSNALPLLAQCDLFILNSEYEGTPVTIDEAKVLGVPVLSKNVGGIRDQLENGKYGQAVSELKADDIKNFNYTACVKTNRQDFYKYNERVTDKLKLMLK